MRAHPRLATVCPDVLELWDLPGGHPFRSVVEPEAPLLPMLVA